MNGFNMDDKNSHEAEKIKIFDKNDNKNDFPSPNNSTPKDESVTIKGQSSFINISHSKERLFNIIDSTSEEEGDIMWQPEEKEVENRFFSPVDNDLGKTQKREMPTRGTRSRGTRRINKNKVTRKYPFHYYIAFYGLPIAVILILAVLVILRYQNLQNSGNSGNGSEKSSEEKLWVNATQKVSQARVKTNYAQERFKKQDKNNAIIYYRKAAVLYTEAIKLGKRLLEIQVSLEKEKKGFSYEQAKKYVNKEYRYYVDFIKKWERNLSTITEKIRQIKAQ
ncbi:hypothetical protein [Candidatus Uabimicrobium sp. HlEnr_7]|uniref:hypothetical protein n=1 Tax=Candidatus Uabimicrobium helgolandensis TaxID=3095367 RepID=UPI0035573E81